MFDVTPDDIARLNDTDLREFIGRLCEAELALQGLPESAVTWGGSQTARDGGLDVRIAVPDGSAVSGTVPRASTGIQVKKPDMARAAIIAEMRPDGDIRPVIQELADQSGAYIIVSSTGSTSDTALSDRRTAMRDALEGVANATQLHTDFYDRTRLATCARRHPAVIAWVKEKTGGALTGWHAFGAWCGGPEGVEAEYLLDDKLRLHLGMHRDAPAQPVSQAIDELRDELSQAQRVVRLVGLSGVGKTRFAQALFDPRIGTRPLPPSLAVYTNMSDDPNPQPVGLASELIAKRARAVLIVDNCPPELHGRLADLCRTTESTVSVLTIEYDVRDDRPEGTHVVTLDTSSEELIETLVARRYPHLAGAAAHTIAAASGGNARIAIALAETVGPGDTIAGLSNENLFRRLFHQRHTPNDSLLLAAQACSLLYSFDGDTLDGDTAELPRLAALADQSVQEIYRHVGELISRDLAQRRGVWRAVLPHAVANRLAARALDDIPFALIEQQLISGGTERLARSFSRRLSFLHGHRSATSIVDRWLARGGLLGDVSRLGEHEQAMFRNVAPVLPEAALAALERARENGEDVAAAVWSAHSTLLRSLAYDAALFERCAMLLVNAAIARANARDAKQPSDVFISLFTLYLSGTHASIEQRILLVERLLRSETTKSQALGLAALGNMLNSVHFVGSYHSEFGARARDYGYQPETQEDVARWYRPTLALIERLILVDRILRPELRHLLGQHFRGLWAYAGMSRELEPLTRRITEDQYWSEGWAACRATLQFDRDQLNPDEANALERLERDLRPFDVETRIRAVVLGSRSCAMDLGDLDDGDGVDRASERLDGNAFDLGAAAAIETNVLSRMLLDLCRGGDRIWWFGRGLVSASQDRLATWNLLSEGLNALPPDQQDARILGGFIYELWPTDADLAYAILREALHQDHLSKYVPYLCSAVDITDPVMSFLKEALTSGRAPVSAFRRVAQGRTPETPSGSHFRELVEQILETPDGFEVALELVATRLFSARSDRREQDPELLMAGRNLLRRLNFTRSHQGDYRLETVTRACLDGADARELASEITARFRDAVESYEAHAFAYASFLRALFEVQPEATLDAVFFEIDGSHRRKPSVFDRIDRHQSSPSDGVAVPTLIAWCQVDPIKRYPFAASIVTFARNSDEPGRPVWSEQALAILGNAPDLRAVLSVFVTRFEPTSWSGSRATLVEANSSLLQGGGFQFPADMQPFIAEEATRLAQTIDRIRECELQRGRSEDERFE